MKLVVALLTCDRYEYTKTTCETFLEHNDPSDFHLYYADDASTDARVPELVEALGFRPLVRHSRRSGCSVTSGELACEVSRVVGEDALVWYLQNDIATIRPLNLACIASVFDDPRVHVLRTYGRWKSPRGWTDFARPADAERLSRMGPTKSPVASEIRTSNAAVAATRLRRTNLRAV